MGRDIIKDVATGREIIEGHKRAGLYSNELDCIYRLAKKNAKSESDILYYAMSRAFYAGVAVGNRQR